MNVKCDKHRRTKPNHPQPRQSPQWRTRDNLGPAPPHHRRHTPTHLITPHIIGYTLRDPTCCHASHLGIFPTLATRASQLLSPHFTRNKTSGPLRPHSHHSIVVRRLGPLARTLGCHVVIVPTGSSGPRVLRRLSLHVPTRLSNALPPKNRTTPRPATIGSKTAARHPTPKYARALVAA